MLNVLFQCSFQFLEENPDKVLFPGGLLTRRGQKDYVGAAFAISGVLFFEGAHTPAVRQAICECFEAYESLAREHLTWVWRAEPPEGPDHFAYAKAKPLREMMGRLDPDDLVSFTYLGGEKSVDASPWCFEVTGWRAWQARKSTCGYSSLRFSLHPLFVLKNPSAFQQMFVDFARRLKAVHGYGGNALVLSPVRIDENQALEAHLAEQLNGLDVGTPVGVSRAVRAGLKTVSWLTAINSEMVEKIGGHQAIRSELPGAWFALYDYGAGLVIQAGPYAQGAAVDDDPQPSLYVLPNMLLKDVRAPLIQSLHRVLANDDPRITGHAAEEWMQRFDVPDHQLLHYKAKLLDEPKLTAETTLPDRIN